MSDPHQLALFGPARVPPPGFVYRPDLITAAEERDLVWRFAELPFAPFRFHGFEGRRRVVSFGWRYDFDGTGLVPAPEIPGWLLPLRIRAADFAKLAPEALEHALLTEYPEGAPIGWHRDRPDFEHVVGVSLASPCTLRFRRRAGARFERHDAPLAPRSAYLLDGPARTEWEHSIAGARSLRYSVTFRSMR